MSNNILDSTQLLKGMLNPTGWLIDAITHNKALRYGLSIIATLSILIGFGSIIYGNIADISVVKRDYLVNTLAPMTILPSITILGLISLAYLINSTDFTTVKLEQLRVDRQVITKKIEEDKSLDIFHTIQLSLNQLDEYYTINKSQATYSFRASMFAIIIGLVTIVAGIWFNYSGNHNLTLAYIAGVGGVLLEFIGGAYFFMYKKSLEQVNFFFSQLIKVQDTMLAINLAEGIKEESKKSDMQEKIIISLLERSLK